MDYLSPAECCGVIFERVQALLVHQLLQMSGRAWLQHSLRSTEIAHDSVKGMDLLGALSLQVIG